jgi:hypothetical protein
MLSFLSFFLWDITLAPMFFVFTMPFHNIRWYKYAKYIMFDVCKVKLSLTSDAPLIDTGYILANHRSFTDFALDPVIADSAIIGRRMAFIPMFWSTLLGYTEHRIFSFVRGKENRQELFQRVKKHLTLRSRILFFPEGTRMKYTHLSSGDELKTYLKYGLLKEIYYDKTYPVQIQISSNKELVINEKKLHIQYGVPVRTHRTKAIYPKDYESEQEFYDAIAVEWYNAWVTTHTY